MKKKCFKCQRNKPIEQFYKHPQMGDGHLGKCKACTKKDVSQNYHGKKEQYAAYDRMRERRPERKEQKRRYQKESRIRNPGKNAARYAVGNAIRDGRLVRQPCEVCGTTKGVEAHHEDYRKPLDVRWLCFTDHRAEHGQEVLQAPADLNKLKY